VLVRAGQRSQFGAGLVRDLPTDREQVRRRDFRSDGIALEVDVFHERAVLLKRVVRRCDAVDRAIHVRGLGLLIPRQVDDPSVERPLRVLRVLAQDRAVRSGTCRDIGSVGGRAIDRTDVACETAHSARTHATKYLEPDDVAALE
jgi:hypothetical protein